MILASSSLEKVNMKMSAELQGLLVDWNIWSRVCACVKSVVQNMGGGGRPSLINSQARRDHQWILDDA